MLRDHVAGTDRISLRSFLLLGEIAHAYAPDITTMAARLAAEFQRKLSYHDDTSKQCSCVILMMHSNLCKNDDMWPLDFPEDPPGDSEGELVEITFSPTVLQRDLCF